MSGTRGKPSNPAWMTTADVAEMFGVHPTSVRRGARLGLIDAVQFGPHGHLRISRESVERLLAFPKNGGTRATRAVEADEGDAASVRSASDASSHLQGTEGRHE